MRVAGVPEHFNAPFLLARDRGLYAAEGIDFQWACTPEGTGAMGKALEAGDVDVAVMLSEGAIARVAANAPMKLVGTYVQSPLRWGIHVKAGAPIKDVPGLKGKTFGISRPLSGSHLMAHVLAHQLGWDLERDAPTRVVGSLDNARAAMARGEIDAWLWEKFTTKHLVDTAEWDIIGEIPTPWPCFVFVASERALAERSHEIQKMVELTKPVCTEFKANADDSTLAYVSEHHRMSKEDAAEWLAGTEWSCGLEVTPATLQKTQEALVVIGQLAMPSPAKDLLAPNLCRLVE